MSDSKTIKSITINNYRSFGPDTPVFDNLKPINILIGPNSSGKSNFANALRLLLKPDTGADHGGGHGKHIDSHHDFFDKNKSITIECTFKDELKAKSKYVLNSDNSVSEDTDMEEFKKYQYRFFPMGPDRSWYRWTKNSQCLYILKDPKLRTKVEGKMNEMLIKTGHDEINLLSEINKIKDSSKTDYDEDNKSIPTSEIGSGVSMFLYFIAEIENTINASVFLIEEPENYMHPGLQNLFLEYLNEWTKEGKQFFITTHSPQFINIDTVKNTFRVYKVNECSNVFIPKDEELEKPCRKDIFQIVNALNNQKIYFADKIILVEGVIDRIIYEKILSILRKIKDNNEVIEIIEVYGKSNFGKFRKYLNAWNIKNYIFADLDYLANIDTTDIKKLFTINFANIKNTLKDKNSKDASKLLKILDVILAKKIEEITDGDIQNIRELYNYIKSRHISLKENITNGESVNIANYIEEQYKRKIYILKKGYIEKYFESGHFDISKAIKATRKINEATIPPELKENVIKILID